MEIKKISWTEYYLMVNKLIQKVKKDYNDYQILAISRGGLIPATLISYQTNQKIDVMNVFSYSNAKKQQDVIIKPFYIYEKEIPQKILIVDDLVDSGNTLFAVYRLLSKIISTQNFELKNFDIETIVLIDKHESIIKPSFSALQLKKSTWIEFPYEK